MSKSLSLYRHSLWCFNVCHVHLQICSNCDGEASLLGSLEILEINPTCLQHVN